MHMQHNVICKLGQDCGSLVTMCPWLQELDALRAAFEQQQSEQQQSEQQEETQPGNSDAALHHQDELIAQMTGQVQQARQDLAGQRAKTMALQQVSTLLQALLHIQADP